MSKTTGLSIDVGDELSKNLTIYQNVDQDIIITTEDKIRLVLISTREILTAQREWWTPLGLLISFVATLVTADFIDILGLSKESWKAIFVILTLASIVWLGSALIKLLKNRNQDDLENIIEKIKLENSKIKEKETIVVEQKRFLVSIPMTSNWNLNHWGKNYATIKDGKMIFKGDGNPKDVDGSNINLLGTLEIGKKYEISCFVKSIPETSALFQLWLHDNLGSESFGVDIKTEFINPRSEGNDIKLLFVPKYNKDLRVHLQYTPGKGQIEVDFVNIMEIVLH